MMRSNRKGRITVMNLLDHPVQLIVFLFLLSVLPLLVLLGTSFLKISVVLAWLRNALGIQQVPPNMALYAIALIFSAYLMAPVGFHVSYALIVHLVDFSTPASVAQIYDSVLSPYRRFIKQH